MTHLRMAHHAAVMLMLTGSAIAAPPSSATYPSDNIAVSGAVQMGLDANNRAWPCGSAGVMWGCPGAGGRVATYAALSAASIPVSSAVNIIATIGNGCYFTNTGTVPIYISLHGTASAASLPIVAGQSFTCPAGSAQAVSAFNASGSVVATVAGEVW